MEEGEREVTRKERGTDFRAGAITLTNSQFPLAQMSLAVSSELSLTGDEMTQNSFASRKQDSRRLRPSFQGTLHFHRNSGFSEQRARAPRSFKVLDGLEHFALLLM